MRALTIGGMGVAAALAVAIPLVLIGQHGTESGPALAPSASAGPGSPPAAGPTAAPAGSQDAPAGLTIQLIGSGTAGILRWTLQPGNRFPLLLEQIQPPESLPVSVGNAVTSYTVTGLNPAVTYCFRIGAVTGLSSDRSQSYWSNTTCTG